MNYAIVFRLLGYVLMIEGALLLLPAAASLVYGEWMVLGVFLLTAAVSAGIGYALHTIKPRSKVFYMREGFAATSLCWVFISVMGAVPFVLTGCIPNPVDALFETVSGFTTTGASILPGVEDLPKGILFWRSFTHWIGGMGVLVFLLSLLPLTGGSHVNLMKAESPGPQVDKLVPKVQSTAKILYGIYLALTVLELLFLLAGHMPLFEAMLTSFGTAGTGGFGFRNDSFGSFSPYIQWVKLRQNKMPLGRLSTSGRMLAPVVVKPDTVSNSASTGLGMQPVSTKGAAPTTEMTIQLSAVAVKPSRI